MLTPKEFNNVSTKNTTSWDLKISINDSNIKLQM